MKFYIFFLCLTFCAIPLYGQPQTKEEIDSLVSVYCQEELYGSALLLMSEFVIESENNEDYETALDYSLKNTSVPLKFSKRSLKLLNNSLL